MVGAPEQVAAVYLRTFIGESSLPKLAQVGATTTVEARLPFLDPDLVDFLNTLPAFMKLHGRQGKYVLRRLMRGRIPDELIDRRKKAFSAPMAEWLRGPLKPLLLERLGAAQIEAGGLFDPQVVSRLVDDHLSGRHDHAVGLRILLMFELWRERWQVRAPSGD